MKETNPICNNPATTELGFMGGTPLPDEQMLRLVCRAVIRETSNMSSFVMERVDGEPLPFKPGQHLTVKVEIDGRTHWRCYSISSSPHKAKQVNLTVKREAGGLVSNWLHDSLRAGVELRTSRPAGLFNIFDRAGGRPLLLSGGSGITPIMSMLRWLADAGELMRVILLHCGRRPEDIAFRDELEALGRQGLDLHFLLSRGEIRSWQHDHRHICGDVLRDLVPDAAHRAAYICGPEGFMSAAQVAVAEIGIQSVYTESFGKNRRTEHPQPDACVNSSNGRVAFLGNGSTYDCAAGETVLDAAEACGIWLNLGCRQGVCGNCRCRLISGSVDMNAVGGLTEEERSEGWILPCCSLPRGPITVQV